MSQQPSMPTAVPFRGAVRALILTNLAIWIGGVLILQPLLFGDGRLVDWFALTPAKLINSFWVWQPLTYMFLHSGGGISHILFNMLSLWWFGTELEDRWGKRFFVSYYLVCGVGAGAIYALGTLIYGLITGNPAPMMIPLVGASGAVFGLLLAYGLLFGERMIFFMMLFPMKARWFTVLIGVIELVTLLDTGLNSSVANLAHLGGIAVGFVYLTFVARWRTRGQRPSTDRKRGRRLKLVVNNDRQPPENGGGPKYWN